MMYYLRLVSKITESSHSGRGSSQGGAQVKRGAQVKGGLK